MKTLRGSRSVRRHPAARHVHRLSLTLALLVGAAALAIASSSASAAGGNRPGGKLVPRQGVMLGAWVDPRYGEWEGWGTRREAEIEEFEAQIGRRLAVSHHFYSFGAVFPSRLEPWDIAGGRVPLISWGGEADFPGLDAINAGTHDATIRERARGVAALGRPVFLRWGWEMNTRGARWGGYLNNDPGTTNGPQKFVAAYQRLHDLFVAEGATNAVWVWAPNDVSYPDEPWNTAAAYYPGDAYVDWVGIDGYNWGGNVWRTLETIVEPLVSAYGSRKPIMIAETGSVEVGGDKARWIRQAQTALKRYPAIAALVYFHSSRPPDWRVTSSTASLSAFAALARDSYFRATAGR